jgi:hypothetical protein
MKCFAVRIYVFVRGCNIMVALSASVSSPYRGQGLAVGMYIICNIPPPAAPRLFELLWQKSVVHIPFIQISQKLLVTTTAQQKKMSFGIYWVVIIRLRTSNRISQTSSREYSKYWLKKCLRRKGKPNVTIMSIKKFRRAWNWKTNVSEKEFDWLIPGRISDYDIYIFRNKYLIKFKSSPPSQREKPKCVSCPSLFGIVWVCVSVCLSVSLSVQSSHVFWTKIQLLNSHVLYSMWRY